ncbi:hypothetical protein [Actinopolyspora xinjiangensis]|nr:hypothetical protein [Actinopolyspora xinjiangensis]
MRRLPTLLGACAMLFALTACAEKQSDVGFGAQPPPPPSEQQSSTGGSSGGAGQPPQRALKGTEVPAERVDASALPDGYPRQVWTRNSGREIVAIGQEGGCGSVRAEVTEQNAERVELALVEETEEPSGPCTMDLRYPPVVASLSEPLADRTVILTQREVKVPADG